MNKDAEHLRLLAIFHFVFAGMVALFSLFPIIHLILGLTVVSASHGNGFGDLGGPPAIFGWLFVFVPCLMIGGGLTAAGLIAYAGRSLQERKRYTYCLVVAGVCCMLMPIGTALGVFSLIVLMRDSVKQEFEGSTTPATPLAD